MTEQDDWQTNFGKALAVLKEERRKMVEEGIYQDPQIFFDWAHVIATKTLEISPVCGGGHLALLSCDEIDKLDNGSDILQGIVDHARNLGVISNVETTSLRYIASVVINMYLDREGLGEKFVKIGQALPGRSFD